MLLQVDQSGSNLGPIRAGCGARESFITAPAPGGLPPLCALILSQVRKRDAALHRVLSCLASTAALIVVSLLAALYRNLSVCTSASYSYRSKSALHQASASLAVIPHLLIHLSIFQRIPEMIMSIYNLYDKSAINIKQDL